jgi:hypothetical protein
MVDTFSLGMAKVLMPLVPLLQKVLPGAMTSWGRRSRVQRTGSARRSRRCSRRHRGRAEADAGILHALGSIITFGRRLGAGLS